MWTHIPILANEIADLLLTNPQGTYMDGTLGLGGHTKLFLSKLGPQAHIFGFDKDPHALQMASERVNDTRLTPCHASYTQAPEVLAAHRVTALDGALFDLGLSSYQLDDPARGFSLLREGPLDMRFDTTQPLTAAEIVNTWPLTELARIFKEYGEERRGEQAAHAILTARHTVKIETTTQLKQILEPALGPQRGRIHPATQIFQALRIACNKELANVEQIGPMLERILKPGARAAVLTFHSLEDRLIKNQFKALAANGEWKLINKHTIVPSHEEIRHNSRARSAKLRVIEKI
ncbi:MAG: 16S rRNA (cytosine(1402)-N(4))-methyltransferase RsmH [Elusimicrobiaceae bacterium]|nr:16S rRNA (cytosine(1402)-N(4))-methyltransferase RsmH [Elusimicrobiaceae bacterium]